MQNLNLKQLYNTHKANSLFGRYITHSDIQVLIDKLSSKFEKEVIGHSVEGRPIYALKIGTGHTKILAWSQMHGNETTTTKAIFDMLNCFESDVFSKLLSSCTLQVIPILNPDGAERYTRLNANAIDLNRDAELLSQPESKVLRSVYDAFNPHFCLNLHGQRTIFGAGETGKPATLSFLSPSQDVERSVTATRKKAMAVIVAICNQLKLDLSDAIGRYDDGFNSNCVGDTFQSLGTPTILYEAGYYANDYNRDKVRFYVFKALLFGLEAISNIDKHKDYESYFKIPENKKNFYDIIICNVKIEPNQVNTVDLAIQFKESLVGNEVNFIPVIENIGDLKSYYAHKNINYAGKVLNLKNKSVLEVGNEIDFVVLNNGEILMKS